MPEAKLNILIIDDSEDDRMLYKRVLSKSADTEYRIQEAVNGEAVIEKLSDFQPDCILLDYSLPGRNGIEVLKVIRSRFFYIPIVMLTGQGNEAVAVNAIQEGAQNYISKSTITEEALQRVIKIAIEHCALHQRIDEQRLSLEIFTRALAHDLKEPVRTIRSFLDLIKAHEKLSTKGEGYLYYLTGAAERMATLIDTVFLYTQLESSGKQISKEVCDTGAVLNEVKENLGELVREHDAAVIFGDMPRLYANPMQLIQVFQNLIANAIYHNNKKPEIRIEASTRNGLWQFCVSDNGPGISGEHREKMFEPFKRFVRHDKQGMGLGLAICKKIIESHNGKIWYDNGEHGGARFFFTLPGMLPDVGQEEHTVQPAAPQVAVSSDGQKLGNVLLVEDNEADIELAKIMLMEEAGLKCNLLVAHDAYEAIATLQSQSQKNNAVDLMLLDINMPGMNGFELMQEMRNRENMRKVPVIICTTSNYSKDMQMAKSLGAIGCITKPAELDTLKQVIAKIDSVKLRKQESGYLLLRTG